MKHPSTPPSNPTKRPNTHPQSPISPLPSPPPLPLAISETTWAALMQKTPRLMLSTVHAALGNLLRKDILSSLPPELSVKILSHLPSEDLRSVSAVCRKWNQLATTHPELWNRLLLKEGLITEDELSKEKDFPSRIVYDIRRRVLKRWMDSSYNPKRYTLQTGEILNVVTCLQLDEDKIAAGSNTNQILIYNTSTGSLRHTLKGHTGGVWAMKFYKNILASGSTDRTVRIWNLDTGRCTHVFKGHTSTVRCLEIIEPQQIGTDVMGRPIIFPTEPLLITGSRDTTLYVWKLPLTTNSTTPIELDANTNPNLLFVLKGHVASVRAVAGHGRILISGSYDATARVWDLTTGECLHVLNGHTDRIYSCVYDVVRNRAYTGSADNTVRIWDLSTGECTAILEGHTILVGLISSSPNVLVSAAADSTVRIWDPDTGVPRHVLRGHTSAITCVENDDYRVVSGSQGMLKLWNAKTGEFIRNMVEDIDGAVWQVAFDYKRCVMAVQKGECTRIEVADFS